MEITLQNVEGTTLCVDDYNGQVPGKKHAGKDMRSLTNFLLLFSDVRVPGSKLTASAVHPSSMMWSDPRFDLNIDCMNVIIMT